MTHIRVILNRFFVPLHFFCKISFFKKVSEITNLFKGEKRRENSTLEDHDKITILYHFNFFIIQLK